MSKINSDVFEAVDFFTTAYLFGIKGTECGMRKMLFLVWSGDKEKREAVTKAYNRVLFGTDQTGRYNFRLFIFILRTKEYLFIDLMLLRL